MKIPPRKFSRGGLGLGLGLRKNRGLLVVYVSAGSSRVKQEKLRGKLSVNYVIVNLRGVASGEFWGACHHPLYEILFYISITQVSKTR